MAMPLPVPTDSPHSLRSRLLGWLGQWPGALFLLVLAYLLAYSAALQKCVTADEPSHLAGGYGYWCYGDYRFQPENGNWPQRLGALPLLGQRYQFDEDDETWTEGRTLLIGRAFLYELGNPADAMMARSRAVMGLLLIATGMLVFVWCHRLLGRGPAWVAVVAWSFAPLVLAHGVLVTSDMMQTFFLVAALGAVWRTWHVVTPANLLLSSFLTAGTFLAKYSGPIFIPFALVLLAIHLAAGRPMTWRIGRAVTVPSRWSQLGVALGVLAFQGVVVWILIWMSYGFRYEIRAPGTPPLKSISAAGLLPKVNGEIGVKGKIIALAADLRLLPEGYLFGLAHTIRYAQARFAFIMGKISIHGWFWYFPLAFAIKTPLSFFALLALALVPVLPPRRWSRELLLAGAPLWVLGIGYWAGAVTSSLNIGLRHVLPTMPILCIVAGAAWLWAGTQWPRRGVVLALLALYAAEAVSTWPDYIAYFNQTIGGPANGYRWLVDSNLDWGQDLPALKRWLDARKDADRPVYFSYFGMGSPAYYAIPARWLPSHPDIDPPSPRIRALEPGTYCISASMLQGVYLNEQLVGPWNSDFEATYRFHASFLRRFELAPTDEERRKLQEAHGVLNPTGMWYDFEVLRFARIISFLRHRPPDAEVGYSILIFELSADDLQRMLTELPDELTEQSSR